MQSDTGSRNVKNQRNIKFKELKFTSDNDDWNNDARKMGSMYYNDTIINDRLSVWGTTLNSGGRKTTMLTFAPLEQSVEFRVGEELMCMSWNLSRESGGTPFDFYCDFRNLEMKEQDAVSVEIIWDVARVFMSRDVSTQLSQKTKLKSVVPAYLLSDETLSNFAKTAQVSKDLVMKFPELTLSEFLSQASNDEESEVGQGKISFIKTDRKFKDRATNPLRHNYSQSAGKDLVQKDPAILPVVLLDSLHTLIIRFSAYLLYHRLDKAYSEYESEEQIEKLESYIAMCSETRKDWTDDLVLPDHFTEMRKVLWEKWNLAFEDDNIVLQIERKVKISNTDIVLLQEVTKEQLRKLRGKLSKSHVVFPEKFPSNLTHSTAICLNKGTVKPDSAKIRSIDDHNFAVLCHGSNINFYVGVVSLTPGQQCDDVRLKEAVKFRRMLGKDPAILGGTFNEDLTAFDNPVAQIMLKHYNGIDHSQEFPLACTTNPTRTNLQFNVARSDQRENGVDNGIYTSFPLVGDASTDFLYPGKTNPADRGPVFQRVRLAMF